MYLSFFQFLLELNLSLSLGFGLYWLLLHKQTTFQWNRRFLIFWPLLCLAISSLQFEYVVWREMPSSPGGSALNYQQFFDSKDANLQQLSTFESSTQQLNNAANPSALNWWNLYFSGAIIALLLFVWRIKKLFILIRMGKTYNQDDFTILEHPAYPQIFSFGRYIFKQKDQEIPEMVLAHELVHVRQRHSVDLLWMELLIILNWFNPFIYRYRKHLKETHEFIADRVVVQQYGLLDYARLLVAQATQRNVPVLALSFAAFTKKRIIAMKTKTHNPWARLRYWIILPLFLVLVTVLAIDRVEKIKPIASEADATVQWGELTCDCYESSIQGMYFCDLEEIEKEKLAHLSKYPPIAFVEGKEAPVSNFSLQLKSQLPSKEARPVYWSDNFFGNDHEVWQKIENGDYLNFKANLTDHKRIEFHVGIKGKNPNRSADPKLVFEDGSEIAFDPINRKVNQTLAVDKIQSLFNQPFYLVRDGKKYSAPISITIRRFFDQSGLSYSFSEFGSNYDNENITLKQDLTINKLLAGDNLSLHIFTGNTINEGDTYELNFKVAGQNPLHNKDLLITWGDKKVKGNKIMLNAEDLSALRGTLPQLYVAGHKLSIGRNPIIKYRLRGELQEPEMFPGLVQKRLFELEKFMAEFQKGETFWNHLSNEYLLIPTEQGILFPLLITLEDQQPNPLYFGYSTSELTDIFSDNFIYPLSPKDITKISSGFGPRIHPVFKKKMHHRGIDLIAPLGTPVLATAQGEVIEVENKTSGYGKKIIIQHADGISSLYTQLQSIGVQEGDPINKGEMIGTVGSSGTSTGPHLHFEIRKEGQPKNPMDYLPELEK